MIVLPGDTIDLNPEKKTVVGPGVYKDPKSQSVIPVSAGVFNEQTRKNTQLVYIDSHAKRYIPKPNDFVVGVVVGTAGEFYKVSLQDFSNNVLLSFMAFPNATKKNRPNLKIGQAVYARVSKESPEIEIECMDAAGKEAGFGELDENGYLVDLDLNFARDLLFNKTTAVLEKLASRCLFEIAIGLNGKVWLKCGEGVLNVNDLKLTLASAKYLQKCQNGGTLDAHLRECFRDV